MPYHKPTAKERSPATVIIFGQLLFIAGIAVCTILMPQYLFSGDEGGMSNFGTHASTVLPFSVAFLGVGTSLCLAAVKLPNHTAQLRALRWMLLAIGVLTLAATITTYPYKSSATFHTAHVLITQILFFAEIPVAIWLWLSCQKSIGVHALFSIYAAGLILAILTLSRLVHVLFIAEALSALGLGFLFAQAARTMTENIHETI